MMNSAQKLNKQGDNIQPDLLLSQLEPICFSMSGSNKWSISFRIFQFILIHTVKGFSIVNEAEVDVFWNSLAFTMIQRMLAI